jgi:hypothetical protein
MAYVNGTNDLTRTLQAYLWRSHASGELHVIGGGISAMPSMHLTLVTLAAIPLWRLGKHWRFVAAAIVTITVVASVHLGWHYAIDGYAGVICALALWQLTRLSPTRRKRNIHARVSV